jgi:hypothetical protein
MKRGFLLVLLAALPLLAPRAARADEFKLKDGSTIVGSVVGYVGNSFRVKTSYGYALVEKDKIVSIRIAGAPESSSAKDTKSEAEKSPAAEKRASKPEKNTRAEEHAAAKKSAPNSADSPASAAMSSISPAKPSPAPETARMNANLATGANPANPVAAPGASTATVAASAPVVPPEPQPIREQVTGNTYINDTYQFQMYKPPDWQVMDGARSVLPGAIAAMGTDDQTTYLVIAQEPAGKSPAADIAATEKRLGDVLVNFRPLSEEHLTISGQPEVVHRFRGSVDEHDWSGFMLFLPRGEKLYTIFGMTRADNDLVQIQENVIRRTISSFQFLSQ